MMHDLSNKYYIKRLLEDEWEDVTEAFAGVKILSIDGFNEKGDAVNVYNARWTDSQVEDMMVTTQDEHDNDVIVRKNVELQMTFICGARYGAQDTQSCYSEFVKYIAQDGDFYIKSKYTGLEAHVVCLKAFKPTTQKLHRGSANSYIMATVELHTLDMPSHEEEPVVGDLYIGFGGSGITSITQLTNRQHYNVDDPSGDYTISCPSRSYLWICTSGTIGGVSSSGFEVPMSGNVVSVGDLRCYRSGNDIKPHVMSFTITS
jgi:hypothetical protein